MKLLELALSGFWEFVGFFILGWLAGVVITNVVANICKTIIYKIRMK